MKKNIKTLIIFVLVTISLITLVSCEKEVNNTEKKEESFEIYLATLESVKEYGIYDYKNLTLQEFPIITDKDIRTYYWQNHEIEITSTYLDKINKVASNNALFVDNGTYRQYEKGGSRLLQAVQFDCFVIVVNGKKIYSGTFSYSPVMSYSQEKIIAADVSNTSFKIFYFGQGEDVRNNDDIFDFFNEKGKLQISDAKELEKKIMELEEVNENILKEKEQLQNDNWILTNKYNEVTKDSKYYKSTSNWFERRVKWYAYETLETQSVIEYTEFLISLNQSDIGSIDIAGGQFRESASQSKRDNDRLFNLFETYYYSVIKSLEKEISSQEVTEEVINTGNKNGIIFSIKNDNVVIKPKKNYLLEYYGPYLTEGTNEYLKALDFEINIINANGVSNIIDESSIKVPLDQFVQIIINWENYEYNYGYYNNMPFFYKGREKLASYFDIYIGKVNLSNTIVYDENYKLSEAFKNSYIDTISKYPNSKTTEMINELYDILRVNQFIKGTTTEQFYQKIKYDLLY